MRRSVARASFITAMNLLVFTAIGTALLAWVYAQTKEPIARSEIREKMKLVSQIALAGTYDNDIMKDTVRVAPDELLGNDEPDIAYIGRLQGKPAVAVIPAVAPDGYGGRIRLVIAVRNDGTIGGVRVVSHLETPGLGDYIEIAKSKWIDIFRGTSLLPGRDDDWQVKKDGGRFDYMTGATISPRAVVKAVHKVLQYFAMHRDELFRQDAGKDK